MRAPQNPARWGSIKKPPGIAARSREPEIFYKPVTALQNPGDPIRIPAEAQDVHFEGELVVVIGRPLHHATREEAEDAVFGVTCGNDVSDRNWQRGPNADRQWWRAKGCDTFAPLGPWITTGLIIPILRSKHA